MEVIVALIIAITTEYSMSPNFVLAIAIIENTTLDHNTVSKSLTSQQGRPTRLIPKQAGG